MEYLIWKQSESKVFVRQWFSARVHLFLQRKYFKAKDNFNFFNYCVWCIVNTFVQLGKSGLLFSILWCSEKPLTAKYYVTQKVNSAEPEKSIKPSIYLLWRWFFQIMVIELLK